MDRGKTLMFLFSAAFIVLLMPKTRAQPRQRPLCVSQFSLVSYACASLPFTTGPGPDAIPTPPSLDNDDLADDDRGGEIGSDDSHQNIQDERHEAGHGGHHERPHEGNGHRHQEGHRGSDEGHDRHPRGHDDSHGDGDEDEDHSEHRHGHRHRHRHHPKYESPAVENCCRWLKELDDECVCDLLIHLPPFLSRPAHDYTLNVGESCEITYHCW